MTRGSTLRYEMDVRASTPPRHSIILLILAYIFLLQKASAMSRIAVVTGSNKGEAELHRAMHAFGCLCTRTEQNPLTCSSVDIISVWDAIVSSLGCIVAIGYSRGYPSLPLMAVKGYKHAFVVEVG